MLLKEAGPYLVVLGTFKGSKSYSFCLKFHIESKSGGFNSSEKDAD